MPSSASSTGSRPADRSDEVDPDPRLRPTATVLLLVEAVMLLAAGSYFLVLATSGVGDPRFGLGLGAFLVLFAVLVALAARSLRARGRFGLGYGVTWQLFQALVAASMLRSGMVWQGALALLLAIATFVLLLNLVRSTPLPRQDG
ncbi:hypothetical protein V1260_02330 [Brachybacterium sp. J144]|uniref:hypothetical protein n=1 Tax=Brachybacterium sp. J144 TaxID=3116487 RepID=UPI002E76BC95|nr:hypothetical protein [Brachybacterium sp. J144]MEE1649623.1 hypothetical protein [Brachybacterium sp. J144]